MSQWLCFLMGVQQRSVEPEKKKINDRDCIYFGQ